jgi:hypothetical protein
MLRVKKVYDKPAKEDGWRVLPLATRHEKRNGEN